jgi:transposase
MYFRWKHTSTGKSVQLVESYRNEENNPRQRILLSIGGPFLPEAQWQLLAEEIHNRLHGILTILEPPEEVSGWVEKIIHMLQQKNMGEQSRKVSETKIIQVLPEAITHEKTAELGPLLAVKQAWESLNMPGILKDLSFSETQIQTAAASVFNRLIDPSSEHALLSWLKTTSFNDLFPSYRPHSKDKYYRIADLLLKHKEAVESHLAHTEESLFNIDRSIYLYDLTNTYFEGECLQIPKAKRGHSKEKRNDAPLLGVGLVFDREGFPLHHNVFSGNLNDHQALLPVILKLDQQRFHKKPTIILDGGFSSESNLQMLIERGYDYIVVGKRPQRLAYTEDFISSDLKEIPNRENKPSVKILYKDTDKERIVLCKSAGREAKERAISSHAENRLLNDLDRFQKRMQKGRLQDRLKAERSLGRIMERHPRAARFYHIEITLSDEGRLKLHFQRLDATSQQVQELSGCYFLRCSRKDLSHEEIWHLYMMLTRVEAGFKALKSTLGLRPIFHHREDRCESHVFITILAYHLLHWIEHKLRLAGDRRSWPTIRRVLQTHAYTTIVCPTVDDGMCRLRVPGTPDIEQKKIYQLLGVNISKLPRAQLF